MADYRQLSDLSLMSVGVLHRQWMRADLMRELADKELNSAPETPTEDQLFLRITVEPFGVYMYLWHALLYSVLEGCKERQLDLSFLQSLDDPLYESMRELRNTVFHTAQGDRYVEDRMFNLMNQPEAARRVLDIHYRIYELLSNEVERRGLWSGKEGAWSKRFPRS